MLKNIVWKEDRMLLGDLLFLLEESAKEPPADVGENYFSFYKGPWTVSQYEQFWSRHPNFVAKNVLELGMWDGGSTAFWFEWLQPQKLVAVDIFDREDSPYFRRYRETRGLGDRVKTYWGTDQGDADKLRRICAQEFDGPLDLVLDDASHQYGPTRASFEALFPLLRPGGLYIIEDWPWAHWPQFHNSYYPVADELTRLVFECAEMTGSAQVFCPTPDKDISLIDSIVVYPHFVVLERGNVALAAGEKLDLDAWICRRPGARATPETLAARDEEIAGLRAELTGASDELGSLRAQLESAGAERDGLRKQVDERIEQVEALHREAAERQGRLESLRQEMTDKTEELRLLKDGEISALRAQLNDTGAERDNLRKQACERIEQLKALHMEAAEREGRLESLRKEMADKNEEIRLLKDQVYDLDMKYTPLTYFTGVARELPRAALRAIKRRIGRPDGQ